MVDTPHGSASVSFAGRPPASGARPARSWARWALRLGIPAHGVRDLSRAGCRHDPRAGVGAGRAGRGRAHRARGRRRVRRGRLPLPRSGRLRRAGTPCLRRARELRHRLGHDAGAGRDGSPRSAVRGAVSERLLGSARIGLVVRWRGAGRHRDRGGGEHPRSRALGEPGGVRGPSGPGDPAPAGAPGPGVRLPARGDPAERALRHGALAQPGDPGVRACDGGLHGCRGDRRHGGRGARSRSRPGSGIGGCHRVGHHARAPRSRWWR